MTRTPAPTFLRRDVSGALGAAILAAALAAALTLGLSLLAGMEHIAADIRVATMQAPMPQSSDIVVLAIDEDTVSRFAYRSPIDRQFLTELLRKLDAMGVRAIGLDLLFDQATEPAKDESLRAALRSLRTPLAVSYIDSPAIVNERQLRWLRDFVPEPLRAMANLATDPFDGSVRWIFPGELTAEMPPGFARRLASHAGIRTPAAQVPIAWRPKSPEGDKPFPIYPAHALESLPPEWIRDKIVLVGAVLSLTDRHRTPLAIVDPGDDGMMPGIIIQAHALSQLLEGRDAHRPSTLLTVLVSLGAALCGMLIGLIRRGVGYKLVLAIAALALFWFGAFLGFSRGLPLLPLIAPTLAMALALWMMDILMGRMERRQRKFVQTAFARYVSPAVVEALVDDPKALAISGKRQDAAFVFTDVAHFTALCESLPPDTLTRVLNAYLDGACRVIFEHGGTIDKFIGDGIMVMFNAPLQQSDYVQRALRCALAIDAFAREFQARQQAQGIAFGTTRIGVHCGAATVGNFGSITRMDFTALGDTVNTAARTESANAWLGTRVLCTESVVGRCPSVPMLPIGRVTMRGKQSAVALFTPASAHGADAAFVDRYTTAFEKLRSADPDALDDFEALARDSPDDELLRFHIERLRGGTRGIDIRIGSK